MIFKRSLPTKKYKDYTRYRNLLREDFLFRCAYCLTQEYFLGGEGGFEIDHHRPMKGSYARPDLESDYTNLYWCCAECNQNKGDHWPAPEKYVQGDRFIDPCEAWGDHERHWKFNKDGTLEPLTSEGRYTARYLMLWREFLVARRRQMMEDQEKVKEIEEKLKRKGGDQEYRIALEDHLREIRQRLEPPVYNRPRRADSAEAI